MKDLDPKFSLHYYSEQLGWSRPILYTNYRTMVDEIEDVMGVSEVNYEIFKWAANSEIGDKWEEDDLIIVRI